MSDDPGDDEQEAVEAGISAAAEEISRLAAWDPRWAGWGDKEMLIADTAAKTSLDKWKQLKEGTSANTATGSAS